jgi:hypothetical protein
MTMTQKDATGIEKVPNPRPGAFTEKPMAPKPEKRDPVHEERR